MYFLAISTNIPQRLKTGFVVQGHKSFLKNRWKKWAAADSEINIFAWYLSACVESVQTAVAALGPVSRLPPRSSNPLPRLLSLKSSWMESGWITGWLRPSSSSGLASPLNSSSRSTATACCACVMAKGGWEPPSLKCVCSSELTYSITLRNIETNSVWELVGKC